MSECISLPAALIKRVFVQPLRCARHKPPSLLLESPQKPCQVGTVACISKQRKLRLREMKQVAHVEPQDWNPAPKPILSSGCGRAVGGWAGSSFHGGPDGEWHWMLTPKS